LFGTQAHGIVRAPPATNPTMKPGTVRHAMNLWPPFLFAGIHVTEISPD
jgi:hypothetical protein